jgi:hypothetical protein
LHDGGQYAYDGNELQVSMSHRLLFDRNDCSGNAYGFIGGDSPEQTAQYFAPVSGQFRWVGKTLDGRVLAFKSGDTAAPLSSGDTVLYYISGGTCYEWAPAGSASYSTAYTKLVPVVPPIPVAVLPLIAG